MKSLFSSLAAASLLSVSLPLFAKDAGNKTPLFGVTERKPAQVSAPFVAMTSTCRPRNSNSKGEASVTYSVTRSGSGSAAWYNLAKANIRFKGMSENFGLGDVEIETEGLTWDSETKMKEDITAIPIKYMYYRSVASSMGIMQIPSYYILFGNVGGGNGTLSVKNLESTEFQVEMICSRAK